MAITSAQVQQLYVAFLGRAADKAGLDYWMEELNGDPAVLTLENLRANFVNEQPEYAGIYGDLTREETINEMYSNLFGRAPEPAGLEYWSTGGGKDVNADQLLVALVNGALGDDAKTLSNKVLVADVYTQIAGAQYTQADAKAILADVTADYASVGDALQHLTDGSLSGIAVPAAVAQIEALVAANKALGDFETSKTGDLKALNDSVDVLVKEYGETPAAPEGKDYAGYAAAIEEDLTGLRGDIGDHDALKADAVASQKDLDAAYKTLLTSETNAAALVKAYQAADARVEKAGDATVQADVDAAQAQLNAYADLSANQDAYSAALKAAGLDSTTDAKGIYDVIQDVNNNDATVNKIVDAFSGISAFADLKDVALHDREVTAAEDALSTAGDELSSTDGAAWIDAFKADKDADQALAFSAAVKALEDKYAAIDDAHEGLSDAVEAAQDEISDLADLGLIVDAATDVGVANQGEVFYFANGVDASDANTIALEKIDSLYIGNDYVFNKGGLSDGNNNALEFFLVQKGSDTQLVIETAAYGSKAAGVSVAQDGTITESGADDQLAIITLTGVSADQLSFENGVLSVA